MNKFKDYLLLNGNSLIFWLRDVMAPTETKRVCTSFSCAELLKRVITEGDFASLTEEECIILFKDFIEPVTYKDIDLMSIDPFYSEVHNSCGKLWLDLPKGMVDFIYGNAKTY